MAKWIDKKYFTNAMSVRKVTQQGSGAWIELQYVLADIKREAALTILPTNTQINTSERGGGSGMTPSVVVPLVVPRPAPPAARPPPPPPPPLPHSPAYSAEGSQQYFAERGRGRGGRGGYERGGGRGGRGAAPFSPLGSTDEGGFEYEPHPHGYSGGGGEGRGRGRGRGRFSPELSSSGVVGGGRFEGRGRGGGGRGRPFNDDCLVTNQTAKEQEQWSELFLDSFGTVSVILSSVSPPRFPTRKLIVKRFF